MQLGHIMDRGHHMSHAHQSTLNTPTPHPIPGFQLIHGPDPGCSPLTHDPKQYKHICHESW